MYALPYLIPLAQAPMEPLAPFLAIPIVAICAVLNLLRNTEKSKFTSLLSVPLADWAAWGSAGLMVTCIGSIGSLVGLSWALLPSGNSTALIASFGLWLVCCVLLAIRHASFDSVYHPDFHDFDSARRQFCCVFSVIPFVVCGLLGLFFFFLASKLSGETFNWQVTFSPFYVMFPVIPCLFLGAMKAKRARIQDKGEDMYITFVLSCTLVGLLITVATLASQLDAGVGCFAKLAF